MPEHVGDLGFRIGLGQVCSLARALRQFGESILHVFLRDVAVGHGGGRADSLYGRCSPITLAAAESKALLAKAVQKVPSRRGSLANQASHLTCGQPIGLSQQVVKNLKDRSSRRQAPSLCHRSYLLGRQFFPAHAHSRAQRRHGSCRCQEVRNTGT